MSGKTRQQNSKARTIGMARLLVLVLLLLHGVGEANHAALHHRANHSDALTQGIASFTQTAVPLAAFDTVDDCPLCALSDASCLLLAPACASSPVVQVVVPVHDRLVVALPRRVSIAHASRGPPALA